MSRCTAPVRGHRTASGRDNCPACGGRYRSVSFGYQPYSTPSKYQRPGYAYNQSTSTGSYSTKYAPRPRWSPTGSAAAYTRREVAGFTPVREAMERQAEQGRLVSYDIFLCHAWGDREGIARELYDALRAQGVKVWFSERDVLLGRPLLRAIDHGLAKTWMGLVLVTPALIERLNNEGIADKELSELLAREALIPVVSGTTFEVLRETSPLLASRSGMNLADQTLEQVSIKIAELVSLGDEPR